MRRRRRRLRGLRWLLWLPVLAGISLIGWLQVERLGFRRLRHWLDGAGLRDWHIGAVHWELPTGLTLTDVQLEGAAGITVVSPRVHVRLGWPSGRGVHIATLSVDRPTLALEREAGQAAVRFLAPAAEARPTDSGGLPLDIESIVITGGRIDWIDHTRTSPPFRLQLQDIDAVAGPWTSSGAASPLAIAFQAHLAQALEQPASIRCAGWLDVPRRGLDLTCDAQNVLVASFEPYYQGNVEVRAYDATLAFGLRAVAVDNQLDALAKLSVGNLSQADLSVLGRTILDIKRLAGSDERVMTGGVTATGQLDRPSTWKVRLVPGNAVVQRLLEAILEHGIHALPIKVGDETVHVGLDGALPAAMPPTVEQPAQTPSPSPVPDPSPAPEDVLPSPDAVP